MSLVACTPAARRFVTAFVLAPLAALGTTPAHAQVRVESLPPALRGTANSAVQGTDSWFDQGMRMRVSVTPSSGRIGEALAYHGSVLVMPGTKVRFEPPKSGGAFTWSHVRAGREKTGWWRTTTGRADSVWFEARLQIFETGRVAVQGPIVQLSALPRRSGPGSVRLPTVRVTILPTLTAADSASELRALHGPLRAPWWERIAWVPVLLALLLILALVYAIHRMRKKKPAPVAAPAAAPVARPRLDPAAEALRALAALRARELPQSGRFGEHAFELTAILRRFLEVTVTTPRPGDTSGELLVRLRSARMPEDDYERLEGLLSLWDRVKFARAPLTEPEAFRCEEAVEAFVRRVANARAAAAAAAARASSPPSAPAPGAPPAPEAA